jgi:hypothetical protein
MSKKKVDFGVNTLPVWRRIWVIGKVAFTTIWSRWAVAAVLRYLGGGGPRPLLSRHKDQAEKAAH